MLTQLHISNIVLIDKVLLTLDKGLCVLSGETGAGKSILLDALGLVLGNRADASLIQAGQQQGQVTAEFDISENKTAKETLLEAGLDTMDQLIIRRVLSKDGKSRCFINDQPAGQALLKTLGESLVEIHGQHDQRTLFEPTIHRQLLDMYANHAPTLTEVRETYKQWHVAKEQLQTLLGNIEKARREEEYLRHIVAELGDLKPEKGEEVALSDKRTNMMQSEKLFEVLNDSLQQFQKEGGLSSAIRGIQRSLARSPHAQGAQFEPVIESLDKAAEALDVAEQTLESIGKEAEYDPQKLERIEERLFAIKAASRKYKVSADELAEVYAQAEKALKQLGNQEKELAQLDRQVKETRQHYIAAAEKLSEKRKAAASKIEKAVIKELASLKMERTGFRIAISTLEEEAWGAHGQDYVVFQAATNLGKPADTVYSPLQKIASGGELSRFMLALKVVLATVHSPSTLIFDEIDTGTGGAVADAIGKRLARLGEKAQVLVVTHLPQVAARGSQHFVVRKSTKKGRIVTTVDTLDVSQRQEEIARMLAGESITAEARKAAARLLEEAA